MPVIVARIGTPLPGKQSEAYAFAKKRAQAFKDIYGVDQEVRVRLGGPVGQIMSMTRMGSLSEVAELKNRVIEDTNNGRLPAAPAGVFAQSEEQVWMVQ